jgi:hypothetical protein
MIKSRKMKRAFSAYGGKRGKRTGFWWGNPEEKKSVGGSTTLKSNLEKSYGVL